MEDKMAQPFLTFLSHSLVFTYDLHNLLLSGPKDPNIIKD